MINFQTSPDRYKHWKLSFDGAVPRLSMEVTEDETPAEGYKLKLSSYDLCVVIELAIACDEIYLVDDGNSAVSLPEVPLLGVLPGTGGLTRLVDKRKIRRDRADVFSTLAEGLKGKRAKEWGLIDDTFATTKFQDGVDERVRQIVSEPGAIAKGSSESPVGIGLSPLQITEAPDTRDYKYVSLRFHRDKRYADLTVRAPESSPATTAEEIHQLGDD